MIQGTRIAAVSALLAGGLLLAIACEDGGVIPPADGTLTATASPATVTIDPGDPDAQEGKSLITAVLLNADGVPVQGVTVLFSTTGGRLVRPGVVPEVILSSAETDSQGVARATLVLTENDGDEVEVTARSGALSGTATVTRNVVGVNVPPTAGIATDPCQRPDTSTPCGAPINTVVRFESTSTDPNPGDVITSRWTITSNVNPTPDVVVTTAESIQRTYSEEQDLLVKLEVSDDPSPTSWDDSALVSYRILCANRAPVAAPPANIVRNGVVPPVTITLDGSNSTDPDGDTLSYQWQCGNGDLPSPVNGNPAIVECEYSARGTYTATLRVTDDRLGDCQKSATGTTTVTLNP